MTVASVQVHGGDMLVPQYLVRLRDEKVQDAMGLRRVGEWLTGMVDYHVWAERTASWWLYRLL
eukprot:24959-Chlamydomonas_euryale.AAC.1